MCSRVTSRMNSPHIGHSFAHARIVAAPRFLDNPCRASIVTARCFVLADPIRRLRAGDARAPRARLPALADRRSRHRLPLVARGDRVLPPRSRRARRHPRHRRGRDQCLGEPGGAGAMVPLDVARAAHLRRLRRPRRGVERALRACVGNGQELQRQPAHRRRCRPASWTATASASTCALPRGPRTRVDVRVAVDGVKRHVEFLSTLYLAWGAIFALVALAGFALAGGAFAIAQSARPGRGSAPRWPRASPA